MNIFCPEKEVYARPQDSPFVNESMKVLKRSFMREYEKRGKSKRYFELKCSFDQKKKNEIKKYIDKIFDDVKNGNRNCTYSALRKLGVRPGDVTDNTFTLPSHANDKLTAQQSAEIIADHFASISQDYDPILFENFTPKMRESLSCPDMAVIPVLQEYQVYERVCKAKKPNSTVPGD